MVNRNEGNTGAKHYFAEVRSTEMEGEQFRTKNTSTATSRVMSCSIISSIR